MKRDDNITLVQRISLYSCKFLKMNNEKYFKMSNQTLEPDVEQILDKLYLDPGAGYSYSNPSILYAEAAKHIPGITKKTVENYLLTKHSYNRFITKKNKFPRRKIIAYSLDDIWEIDLCFVGLKNYNYGRIGIVIITDVLSGYCEGSAIRNKSAAETCRAFEDILRKMAPRKCRLLFSDLGREMVNKDFSALLEKHNIRRYSTHYSIMKAAHVERKIRFFKSILHRICAERNTFKWIDFLDEIFSTMNSRVSRPIGIAPKFVTKKNEQEIFKKRYLGKKSAKKKFSFKSGDYCRIKIDYNPFQKGYRPRWTQKIFRVKEARATFPHTYLIHHIDEHGEYDKALVKPHYSAELVKVVNPNFNEKLRDPPIPKPAREF